MNGQGAAAGDWVATWIAMQREALGQWSAKQGGEAVAAGTAAIHEFLRQLETMGKAGEGIRMPELWRQFVPPAAADLPGLGPLREQQEELAALDRALADYQRLAGEMLASFAQVHRDTLDLLARRAAEEANAGKPLTSFKTLFDLWIDCGEQTYARLVHGDAYCRLQAEFANAGLRVRERQQALIERWLRQLDLPTRSELNGLHRRVQALQAQVGALNLAVPQGRSAPPAAKSRKTPRKTSTPARQTATARKR